MDRFLLVVAIVMLVSRFRIAVLVSAASVLFAAPARGAMVGTPFSGPTHADASVVFWNPGAMSLLERPQGMVHGAVIPIRVHYRRDYLGAGGEPYPQANMLGLLPDLFVGGVSQIGDRLRLGLGVSVPLVDGADWNTSEGGQPSPARYYTLKTFLAWLFISPAASLRINRYISIGAGVDITAALLQSNMVIDFGARVNQLVCQQSTGSDCAADAPLPREDPTYDAPMDVSGMAWDVGGFVGVLLTPTPWLRLGGVFHSGAGEVGIPVDLDVQIPADVRQYMAQNLPTVTLPPIHAAATLKTHSPMMVAASAQIAPTASLELGLDFQWVDKSRMSIFQAALHRTPETSALITDQVVFNPFKDYLSFGLRGSYRLLGDRLALALGLAFEPNTRLDSFASPMLMDMHKIVLRVGVSWRPTRWVTVVLDYGRFFVIPRTIEPNLLRPNANPTTPEEEALDRPSPTGRYWAEADRVGIGILLHF